MKQASQVCNAAKYCTTQYPLSIGGCLDITMYETLIRPHEVNQIPTLQSVGEISEKLKQAEHKREEKRLRQIALSRFSSITKRKRSDVLDEDPADPSQESGNKRTKTDDEDETMEPPIDLMDAGEVIDASSSTDDVAEGSMTKININVSKALPEVRGHTSYLTFACLVPSVAAETGVVNEASAVIKL